MEGRKGGRVEERLVVWKVMLKPVNVFGKINFSDPHFLTYKMDLITVITS